MIQKNCSRSDPPSCLHALHTHMHYIHTCITYTYIHALHTYIHTCITYMHIALHTYMHYIHTYIHIHTYIQSLCSLSSIAYKPPPFLSNHLTEEHKGDRAGAGGTGITSRVSAYISLRWNFTVCPLRI